jgi:hypothetical protein
MTTPVISAFLSKKLLEASAGVVGGDGGFISRNGKFLYDSQTANSRKDTRVV